MRKLATSINTTYFPITGIAVNHTGRPYIVSPGKADQQRPKHNYYQNKLSRQVNVNLLPDACILLTGDGIIQQANKVCDEVYRLKPNEIQGKNYFELVVEDDLTKVQEFIHKVRTYGSAKDFIHKVHRKDNCYSYISWSSTWLHEENIMLTLCRDVTVAKEAEQKQITKETLLQSLVENSFDLLALLDETGKYTYVSESIYKTLNYVIDPLLGYKANELTGTNVFDYMHPEDQPWIIEQFQQLFQSTKKIQFRPCRFRDATGNWRWMEAIVTNQLNHPDIKAIVVSCRDVTQQINAESRLKEMQLLEALVEGEEKERSRIARDLHDEVLGMIAAAKMQFSALTEKKPDLYELKEYIQGMELLQAGALQVRKTSHNLMPEILLEDGLDEAISRYCTNISNDKLNIEYFSVGNIERFSPNFELSLYRIVQELINNILRHSGANSAFVQLSRHTNNLSLTIEDNGKGFKATGKMKGTGLQSVKKRVEAMNGQMEIISEPGKGTSVYLEFEK